MKSLSIACAAVAVIALVGCASDVANRFYGGERFAARPVEQVALLWQKPERPFTVIADFQSRGESPKDLQKKAAAIGADAVIVSLLGGHYSGKEEWAGEDRYSNTYSRIAGTAIKYER